MTARHDDPEDEQENYWEEVRKSAEDVWEDLTTFPAVVTIMGAPFTLDSTDVPSWMSLSTDDLPDALRSRLQSNVGTRTQTITSIITKSATISGQSPIIQTTILVSTIFPEAGGSAPRAESRGLKINVKIALAVGIPVGVVGIAILIISGFLLGRLASKFKRDRSRNIEEQSLWATRESNQSSETSNLPVDDQVHELPTKYNIQEMPEERRPIEVSQRSPVELG